jgi:hypothetical protein
MPVAAVVVNNIIPRRALPAVRDVVERLAAVRAERARFAHDSALAVRAPERPRGKGVERAACEAVEWYAHLNSTRAPNYTLFKTSESEVEHVAVAVHLVRHVGREPAVVNILERLVAIGAEAPGRTDQVSLAIRAMRELHE